MFLKPRKVTNSNQFLLSLKQTGPSLSWTLWTSKKRIFHWGWSLRWRNDLKHFVPGVNFINILCETFSYTSKDLKTYVFDLKMYVFDLKTYVFDFKMYVFDLITYTFDLKFEVKRQYTFLSNFAFHKTQFWRDKFRIFEKYGPKRVPNFAKVQNSENSIFRRALFCATFL